MKKWYITEADTPGEYSLKDMNAKNNTATFYEIGTFISYTVYFMKKFDFAKAKDGKQIYAIY